jgi:hypothetical protein
MASGHRRHGHPSLVPHVTLASKSPDPYTPRELTGPGSSAGCVFRRHTHPGGSDAMSLPLIRAFLAVEVLGYATLEPVHCLVGIVPGHVGEHPRVHEQGPDSEAADAVPAPSNSAYTACTASPASLRMLSARRCVRRCSIVSALSWPTRRSGRPGRRRRISRRAVFSSEHGRGRPDTPAVARSSMARSLAFLRHNA